MCNRTKYIIENMKKKNRKNGHEQKKLCGWVSNNTLTFDNMQIVEAGAVSWTQESGHLVVLHGILKYWLKTQKLFFDNTILKNDYNNYYCNHSFNITLSTNYFCVFNQIHTYNLVPLVDMNII